LAGSTLVKRNIASGLANTGGDGTTPLFVDFMDTVTAASAEQSYTVPGLTTSDLKFVSRANVPGNTDWDNGTYTWNFRNGAATSLVCSLITAKIRRLSSDGQTLRAGKTVDLTTSLFVLNTAGLQLTGTVVWNDGTQNPAGRASADIIEVVFQVKNTGATGVTLGLACNTKPNTDEIVTPIIYARTMTETKAISETLARKATKFRSMTETKTISDSLSKIKTQFRTMTETKTISDTLTRTAFKFRTMTETPAISETLARMATKFRAPGTETVAISSSVAKQRIVPRTLTETVTITSTTKRCIPCGVPTAIRNIAAEQVAISDSISVKKNGKLVGGGGGGGGTPSLEYEFGVH
jgi:hypothetical protein